MYAKKSLFAIGAALGVALIPPGTTGASPGTEFEHVELTDVQTQAIAQSISLEELPDADYDIRLIIVTR